MDAAALPDDPLRPRSPGGNRLGTALAVIVHVGLVVALAIAVKWRASEPEGVTAELWASVPQAAAPAPQPAPAPPPVQPAPAPTPPPPTPKPEPRVEPAPAQPDAQIAIEKERKERLEKERLEQEKLEKAKLEKEREEREKEQEKAAELKRKQEQEAQRKQKAEEERMAKLQEQQRQEQLRRIQGMAGATGGPTATGNAMKDAGPSAGYAGRIKARIKPNIVFGDELAGNPTAEVEVRAAPDGTIIGRKLLKSSGSREWDEAVLRAIDRTEVLPRDLDGRVPSPMVIAFRPRE